MSANVVVVEGFTVVPIKFNSKSKAGHHLFIKEHNVKENELCKPKHRTLFVLNVPPYCGKEELENIFNEAGNIQEIYIHQKPTSCLPSENISSFFKTIGPITGTRCAYIVFQLSTSIQKAKCFSFDECKILANEAHQIPTGLKKWCLEYEQNICDTDLMKKEIDKWMIEFDTKAEEEKSEAKENEGIADDEGWITVTKYGRNKPTPQTEIAENKILSKEKRKRKRKELGNFYAFQMKDSKKEYIAQLRQKFEEDKKRIEMMKNARRFKPF